VSTLRILFVQDNGINESLALTEASALLRQRGHHGRLVLTREEPEIERLVRQDRPDLVIIPGSILARGFALSAARRIKAVHDAPIVLCGTLPTFFPDVVADPAVDFICVGEADEALAHLVETIRAGGDPSSLPNIRAVVGGEVQDSGVRPMIPDLDALPLPDRELYYRYPFLRDFPWKKFAAGRGCVHSCAYCYQPTMRRMYRGDPHYVRLKSPRRVVAEVLDVRARAALTHVHFSDDLFTVDSDWIPAMADRFAAEVGLPFTCNTSAELITPTVAQALRRGGCVGVAIGVESGDEALRCDTILDKQITDEAIRSAAACIHEAGLKLITFNMLGMPGERLEQALATLRLNREIGADHVRICFAYPIPGTAMFERALASGELDADTASLLGSERLEFVPGPVLYNPDAQELEKLYRLFRLCLKAPRGEALARWLLRLPTGSLERLLAFQAPLTEQRIFGLPWLQGLRYFRHCGPPDRRTTNFTSLP
jgi:anaerobic magnesium-protoporphyrin IX monomethyl ester cyclase